MEPIQASVLERLKSMACSHFNLRDLAQLPIVVAYSGGLDSSVLLHACHQLQQQDKIKNLTAAHVNHGIQQQNDAWEQHCVELCERYQITLFRKQFELSSLGSVSENEARAARYQFFEHLLEKPRVMLFAHHLDDQVETMLFRMIRGTGVKGLAGIPDCRQLANGWLMRPLLETSRSQIEDYAKRHHLDWVEDPSNSETHFSRNYLRNRVIPNIQSKWPEFSRAFNQLRSIASEQSELVSELAAKDVEAIQQANSSLSIKKFNLFSTARQKNLLHYWVRLHTGNSPGANEINEVINQLQPLSLKADSSEGQKAIKVKLGQGWLRSFNKHLYFCSNNEPAVLTSECRWENCEQPLVLGNGVSLEFINNKRSNSNSSTSIRKPLPSESVIVRARQGGEIAKPSYRAHSTELKKIFQELDVPPWKRKWLPIIYFNEKIACIPGVFVDQAFAAHTSQWQIKIKLDLA